MIYNLKFIFSIVAAAICSIFKEIVFSSLTFFLRQNLTLFENLLIKVMSKLELDFYHIIPSIYF